MSSDQRFTTPPSPPGVVPYRCDDGARLHTDRRDLTLLVRLRGRPQSVREDRLHVQTVLGAAVVPVPLRLR